MVVGGEPTHTYFIVTSTETLQSLAQGDLADIRPCLVLLLGLGLASGAASGGGGGRLLALCLLFEKETVSPRQRRHQPAIQELVQIPENRTERNRNIGPGQVLPLAGSLLVSHVCLIILCTFHRQLLTSPPSRFLVIHLFLEFCLNE